MKLKHIIRIIIFTILTALIIAFTAVLLSVPSERDVMGVYGFGKEPEDSIDVILIGASEMYTSFYAPLAYEKYGFTSYPLAVSTMTGIEFKSAVQLAMESNDPQLYVVSLWSFAYADQHQEVSLRKWLDSLPAGKLRSETIEEIVPEELKESFRFRFLKYHSNWTNIDGCFKVLGDKADIAKRGYSVTKNFSTTYDISPVKSGKHSYRLKDEGMDALKDFLEFLNSEGIENVLFIRTPEMYTYIPEDSYYEALKLIDDAGFDYLNMAELQDEKGISLDHDFYNPTHLNIFGAETFTEWLGEYITEHYDLDIQHRPEVKEEWDICASYNEQVFSKLEMKTENRQKGYIYTQKEILEGLDAAPEKTAGEQ